MRSETTILRTKLNDSVKATKLWMVKAQSLETEINELKNQLHQAKGKSHAVG